MGNPELDGEKRIVLKNYLLNYTSSKKAQFLYSVTKNIPTKPTDDHLKQHNEEVCTQKHLENLRLLLSLFCYFKIIKFFCTFTIFKFLR